jgi:hypothetical protein
MSSNNNNIGVIYLAFGYEYAVQAVQSACSLKSIHPNMNITIVTNVPLKRGISSQIEYDDFVIGSELFNDVIYIEDSDESNRNYKTAINNYSPYKKTLFLDCDTIIKSNILSGFKILDYADIAALYRPTASGPMVNSWGGKLHVEGLDLETISSFYSGIIFFDKDETKKFFEKWNKKYNEFGYEYDQYSFTHSIITTDIKHTPLPASWNAMDGHLKSYKRFDNDYDFEEKIKIRHKHYYTASRMLELKTFEEKVARYFLDIEDRHHKQNIRGKFNKKFNNKNVVKTKLAASDTISKLYSLLFK